MGIESSNNSWEALPNLYDTLRKKALAKLVELYPDKADAIRDGKGMPIDSFLTDILFDAGIEGSAVFHRLDEDRQRELLEERDLDSLFANPSASVIEHYRERFSSNAQPFDPLTDDSVEEV